MAGPMSGVSPRSASTEDWPPRSDATTAQHGAGTQGEGFENVTAATALDSAAQRALKHTQLGGEVEPRHRQRDFAGATELSSPLSSGPDGAV